MSLTSRPITRYHSSWRVENLETTLLRAAKVAPGLGITRVTDITHLDRIGIPVFASIRPGAAPGSLCVNAGKGVTSSEARVGAYMEAIEFARAEEGNSDVTVHNATARDVLDGNRRPEAILDLCPSIGAQIRLKATLPCVMAEDLLTGSDLLVPAELVFLPVLDTLAPKYFGESSNGLASGNSVVEASLHGLCEVIERDIRSFHAIRDTTRSIPLNSLPGTVLEMVNQVQASQLHLFVRWMPHEFGLPCFIAAIYDPEADTPIFVSGGYGCHLSRDIALTRAICEAAQSRLSYIHGGRDDLAGRYQQFASWKPSEVVSYRDSLIRVLSSRSVENDYQEVPDLVERASDLEAGFEYLVQLLARNGIGAICRVRYTRPADDLQVVRIIVPRLEHYSDSSRRIGPRLRDFSLQHAS